MKRFLLALLLLALALALTGATWLFTVPGGLRALTGEESVAAQVRALGHLLSGRLRPYPATAPLQPVRHAGLYPFGINTFLQNETEPEKVERSLDMIADGGFRWIRQEFAWEDLEIHRDDWFVDLRNNEVRNAWDKYDRIVELAEARDIQIIARLSTPPFWSREADSDQGAKAPPATLDAYGDYVEAVVSRYEGRVRYFQIWNEPNCCEEWGTRSVSPEQYVDLLRVAYTRAKAANPDAVILTAPLAPTIEMVTTSESGPPAFNDFLFLQRMYDAGAKDYFDVLAVQDYGLWSGPYDRRMRPRVINYSRPEYARDIMLRNGDGEKAIWISEMGWNSTPPPIAPLFGAIPEEWRGTYLEEAFERQQQEWPWVGVATVWFFKQASDEEADQPQYYFKLVNPDFTPTLAWGEFTEYIRTLQPTLYRGFHQEDHWVLRDAAGDQPWPLASDPDAIFEQVAVGQVGNRLTFIAEGERLALALRPDHFGRISVYIEGSEQRYAFDGEGLAISGSGRNDVGEVTTAAGKRFLWLPLGGLSPGPQRIEIVVEEGEVVLDGVIVE
ncbi:MAG TPA: cellulase family glycosylhydrolase [Ardenticatenaceae bacterium]|jgi:hypothetical protein